MTDKDQNPLLDVGEAKGPTLITLSTIYNTALAIKEANLEDRFIAELGSVGQILDADVINRVKKFLNVGSAHVGDSRWSLFSRDVITSPGGRCPK